MSVAGDTAYYSGGLLGLIETQAILQLEKVNVMRPLVTVKSAPRGDTISWSVYNDETAVATATDVVATAEGTVTPTTEFYSKKHTATMDMYSIGTDVYDESKLSNADDVSENVGKVLANAASAKIDELLCANFDNFSNAVNTTSNAITIDDLFQALALINVYDQLGEISGVFDRRMIWGTYGIMNDLVTSTIFGGSPDLQQEGLRAGWVSKIAGIGMYNSNQLATAISSAQKAGIFTREAIGWGVVGPELKVEVMREADFIRDRYNLSFFAGTAELKDSAGVEVFAKVS